MPAALPDPVVLGNTQAEGDGNAFSEAVSSQAREAGLTVPVPVLDDSPPTIKSTTPRVDVIGGLLTSLSASVESYQERQISLAFRLNSLLADASRTSGDGVIESATAMVSNFKRTFQVLLRENSEVTSMQTGNLTLVLKMFDDQLARQLEITAGLSTTMEAIQEGLASQQRFLKELVTTQVFLDTLVAAGWDGTGAYAHCASAACRQDAWKLVGDFSSPLT